MSRPILFYCLILLSTVSFSRTLYVSKDGLDTNPGTRPYPFKTLQKASDIAQPGDTVYILPGSYHQNLVIEDIKGTMENPLVFRGIGKVILDAPSSISMNDTTYKTFHFDIPLASPAHLYHPYYLGSVIRLDNSTHIIIDGIEVQNSSWFGFAAFNCKHLVIQNCRSEYTMASGIYILDSEYVTIINNEITRACANPERIPGSYHGSQECISIVNTVNFEVAYNTIHESGIYTGVEGGGSGVGGEGIDVKEKSHDGSVHHNHVYNLERVGIYLDSWNAKNYGNIKVYNNIVHDCYGGIAPGAEDGGIVDNIDIFNNLIFNNQYYGIAMQDWVVNIDIPGLKKNMRIFNNTIYNNGSGINLGVKINRDIHVYNNISFKNGENGEDNFNPGEAENVRAENNLFGEDPMFNNVAGGDFRIKKNSPAINKGIKPSIVKKDLNRNSRIIGEQTDIGALEFNPL